VYAGGSGSYSYKTTNGGDLWTANPSGAINTHALVVDPSTSSIVYAAADNGVFKYVDGVGWTPIDDGIPSGLMALSLVIDPKTPRTLYVGTDRGGVFKTLTGGQ
jgi:hypothetical protein